MTLSLRAGIALITVLILFSGSVGGLNVKSRNSSTTLKLPTPSASTTPVSASTPEISSKVPGNISSPSPPSIASLALRKDDDGVAEDDNKEEEGEGVNGGSSFGESGENAHDSGGEGEKDVDLVESAESSMETIKIQDILRHIFVDEFEESAEEEDAEEEEAEKDASLGRNEPLDFQMMKNASGGRMARWVDEMISEEEEEEDDDDLRVARMSPNGNKNNKGKNKNKEAGSGEKKPGVGNLGNKNKNKRNQNKRNNPKNKNKNGKVSVDKYNQYMDAVLKRMNTLIRGKRMDPLSVNLFASPNGGNKNNPNNGNGNGNKKNNKKKQGGGNKFNQNKNNRRRNNNNRNKNKNKRKNGPGKSKEMRMEDGEEEEEFQQTHEHDEQELGVHGQEEEEEEDDDGRPVHDVHLHRKVRSLIESGVMNFTEFEARGNTPDFPDFGDFEGNHRAQKHRGSSRTHHAPHELNINLNVPTNSTEVSSVGASSGSASSESSGESSASVGNVTSPPKRGHGKGKQNPGGNDGKPTRGTLHGLSSLRRDGNVAVIKQGPKARLVRARFLLGPVALEIHPKKAKSGEKERGKNAMAVATAPELKGILEVRLKQGAATRIRKLRVFPPKKVSVKPETGRDASVARPKYNKVSPMATARLRQVAVQVLQLADNMNKKRKSHRNTN